MNKPRKYYLLALLVGSALGLTACGDDDFEVLSGPGCTSVRQADGSTKTTCPNGCTQIISADGDTETISGPCATE